MPDTKERRKAMVFRVERRHGKGILDICFFGMAQNLETIKKFFSI